MTISPSDFYARIVLTTPGDLPDQIFHVLTRHVGWSNAISKEDISMQVFGKYTNTTDRQIRDAIETLRKERIAVLSASGKAGYCLASSASEKQETIADIEARIENLKAVSDGLRKAQVPPPVMYQPQPEAVQMGLGLLQEPMVSDHMRYWER